MEVLPNPSVRKPDRYSSLPIRTDIRKRPQPVTTKPPVWEPPSTERVLTPAPGARARAVAQATLPRPLTQANARAFLRSAAADFVLAFAGLVSAHYILQALESLVRQDLGVLACCPLLPRSWTALLVLLGTLITLLGHSEGLYRQDLLREPKRERMLVVKTACLATVLLSVIAVLLGDTGISLALVIVATPFNTGAMLGWRRLRRSRAVAYSRSCRNVLIVGAGTRGRDVAAFLAAAPWLERKVCGFLDDSWGLSKDVLGRVEDLARVARAEFVDEVIFAIPQEQERSRRAVAEALQNRLDVKFVPDIPGFPLQEAQVENVGCPVVTLHEESIPRARLLCKRVFDCVAASAGLVALSPLLAAIAVTVRLDSTGPAFYRAARVGRKGRRFACFKFRTMTVDADVRKARLLAVNQRQGPFFKMRDDPRITRMGKFLRRYSLDELPQLWNVVLGDMSLVGPRPHPLDDYQRYELEDLRRLDVLPGITGLWQITARQDPSFQRSMALDLEYIRTWSLWNDLRILCKTLATVVRGSGT